MPAMANAIKETRAFKSDGRALLAWERGGFGLLPLKVLPGGVGPAQITSHFL